MKVTEKDVLHVAGLANLELTDTERIRMVKDLGAILEYIDRLNRLDTSHVEPMAQTSDRFGVDKGKQDSERFQYALRPDVTGPSLDRHDALRNAPDSEGTFFKVPKVIDK